jgi:uncharacterized repeat protein (TIGR03943 family)
MNEEAQAGVIFALGAVALRLGLTDAHLAYIQPAMGAPLAVAGAVLAILGGMVLLRRGRARDGGADEHGHDHGGSRIGWLLLAPILAISMVAPNPLGAFAADRAPATLPVLERDFGPLPAPTAGAVDLPLTDFVGRAVYGQGESLRGVPVRLVGFAATEGGGEGLVLTRFVISCCAADARPVRVRLRNADTPWPAPDTWLEVTGTWYPETRSGEDTRPPTLEVTALRTILPPENRYLR